MLPIADFKRIIERYKIILFDSYGVIKNHKGLVPGMEETFAHLHATGKEYYILTNDASRSPLQLTESLHRLGLNTITQNRIISSGMLAKEYLDLKVHNGIAAYLGTPDSAHYIDSSGLHTLPVSEINGDNYDQINALVFLDDEGFDWCEDLNKAVNLLRRRNIPTIVANTDYAYPVNKADVAIAIGGLASMVEKIVGKRFIRFGKPDSQMFTFAFNLIKEHSNIGKKDILMVGDTLQTDILGGNKFGLDTVLVLTGNTLAHEAEISISTTGIVPTYICESAAVI